MNCVILVTGMPGSGKSLVKKAAEKLNLPVVSMGDVVREQAILEGIPLTPEGLGKLAINLRDKYGDDIIAKLTIDKILGGRLNKSKAVIVEGVRSWSEVESFRKIFERTVIVTVHAPRKVRFKRLISRCRRDDPRSWDEFEERDERELKWGIGKVIAFSDYIILNYEHRSPEEVVKEAEDLIRNILREMCGNA